MMPACVAFAFATSLFVPLSIAQRSGVRETDGRTRQIYVSVLDSTGKPVSGLSAADFIVREDGVAREVLTAAPATEQLTISLLIDDSQAATNAIQHMREGLNAFVDKLQGQAEIALATVGERPTSVVDYTTSVDALKRAIGRIFARPGAGAYLLDGIIDVSRGLRKREPKRAAIVALTMEQGEEFSNRHYDVVLEALQQSGAALHVLAVGTPSSSLEDEMRNRAMVLAEGSERTGGRRDQLLSEMSIPEKLKQVADELTHQYLVSYGRPETLIPPEKLDVSVKRPGLTVRAPKRVGGRP